MANATVFALPASPDKLLRLPIDPFVPEVVEALRAARDVVLVAEPGAGKTTRVAPAIVRAPGLCARPNEQVVMLQPRRVAARAAAARIGEEQGWRLGEEVGYQVRFERVIGARTRLHVVTEGILERRLVADPSLAGIGCVILDEFHERSIHADLSLAMLREAKAAIRPDLRLVVMSATLDADAVAAYLRAKAIEVEVFHVPGRLFPVDVDYAGDRHEPVEQRVRDVLQRYWQGDGANSGPEGDILVFLPGVREIERTISAVDRLAARSGYDVLPLHGSLTKEEQDRAVRFDPSATPRVICATNIAETSLTLPGVRLVIDSGVVRQANFDPARGLERLETLRISKASAQQRAGRAGRVAAGRCVRLWSKMTQVRRPEFDVPEIRRVDLSEAVLAVRAWGQDPGTFGWFDPPDPRLLASAAKLLEMIGALESGRLTTLGRVLQGLPLHPRAARLLTAAPARLLHESATVAALLSEGAEVPGRRTADIHELLEALASHKLEPTMTRAVGRARDALLRIVEERIAPGSSAGKVARRGAGDAAAATRCVPVPVSGIEQLLLLAYPDRVCKRRPADPTLARLVEGGGVRLPDAAAVRGGLFLALDVRQGSLAERQQADVRLVAAIEEAWLETFFPAFVHREETAEWDAGSERVVLVRRRRYRDLVLAEEISSNAVPLQAEPLLYRKASERGTELLEDELTTATLARRMAMLERHLPAHLRPQSLPAIGLDSVLADAVSAAVAAGEPSLAGVRRRLAEAYRARLASSPWQRLLSEHAPETIQVPSGSRIQLDWTAGRDLQRGPVLPVRLQELFGLDRTPRVCGGAIPVVLHLLGPNFRPVQITEDLASFWSTTYPQVRKDLRARYPRHAWPENPITAAPARGVRRPGRAR